MFKRPSMRMAFFLRVTEGFGSEGFGGEGFGDEEAVLTL
jgi:hypothetical protein